MSDLSLQRRQQLIQNFPRNRILVIGDVMLDTFIWGRVSRISPEAPVPIVDFEREDRMPGGAANVARNLSSLGARAIVGGAIGKDAAAKDLREGLIRENVQCTGLITFADRLTTTKTRIIAGQQQITRLDRETRTPLNPAQTQRLLRQIDRLTVGAQAIVVGDYGKGAITQALLDFLRKSCRERGIWLSLDPKPTRDLDLRGFSLITPNRKEAFDLAGIADTSRHSNPPKDIPLLRVSEKLLSDLKPALLLITLGEQGMLLCQRDKKPFHIPTIAREVFDVSGAGDTVIATFTLAIASGASPIEAAILSNHAAGVVVGKRGTATVHPTELLASFL